jgi:hypothetical protein
MEDNIAKEADFKNAMAERLKAVNTKRKPKPEDEILKKYLEALADPLDKLDDGHGGKLYKDWGEFKDAVNTDAFDLKKEVLKQVGGLGKALEAKSEPDETEKLEKIFKKYSVRKRRAARGERENERQEQAKKEQVGEFKKLRKEWNSMKLGLETDTSLDGLKEAVSKLKAIAGSEAAAKLEKTPEMVVAEPFANALGLIVENVESGKLKASDVEGELLEVVYQFNRLLTLKQDEATFADAKVAGGIKATEVGISDLEKAIKQGIAKQQKAKAAAEARAKKKAEEAKKLEELRKQKAAAQASSASKPGNVSNPGSSSGASKPGGTTGRNVL